MRYFNTLFLLIAFIIIWGDAAISASDSIPPLAVEVVNRNAESLRLIQTFQCNFSKTEYNGAGKLKHKYSNVEYWRANDSFRARYARGQYVCDEIVQGFDHKSSSEQLKTCILGKYKGLPLGNGDPWYDAKQVNYSSSKDNPHGGDYTACLVATEVTITCRNELHDSRPVVAVSLVPKAGKGLCELWFDPSRNHLLVKHEVRFDPGTPQEESQTVTVQKFVEPAAGIFYPSHAIITDSKAGVVQMKTECVYFNIRINQPLPKNIFTIECPTGMNIFDQLEGTNYKLARDGSKYDVRTISPAPPVAGGVEPKTETKVEPTSFPRWLAPSFGILAILGIVVIVWKKRRARRAETI